MSNDDTHGRGTSGTNNESIPGISMAGTPGNVRSIYSQYVPEIHDPTAPEQKHRNYRLPAELRHILISTFLASGKPVYANDDPIRILDRQKPHEQAKTLKTTFTAAQAPLKHDITLLKTRIRALRNELDQSKHYTKQLVNANLAIYEFAQSHGIDFDPDEVFASVETAQTYFSTLSEKITKPLAQEQDLEHVTREANRLRALIRGLPDLARQASNITDLDNASITDLDNALITAHLHANTTYNSLAAIEDKVFLLGKAAAKSLNTAEPTDAGIALATLEELCLSTPCHLLQLTNDLVADLHNQGLAPEIKTPTTLEHAEEILYHIITSYAELSNAVQRHAQLGEELRYQLQQEGDAHRQESEELSHRIVAANSLTAAVKQDLKRAEKKNSSLTNRLVQARAARARAEDQRYIAEYRQFEAERTTDTFAKAAAQAGKEHTQLLTLRKQLDNAHNTIHTQASTINDLKADHNSDPAFHQLRAHYKGFFSDVAPAADVEKMADQAYKLAVQHNIKPAQLVNLVAAARQKFGDGGIPELIHNEILDAIPKKDLKRAL